MVTPVNKGNSEIKVKALIVKEALERVRLKLIDLSRRNNLLNFKETRRTIRIVDELPDETFRLLVSEGKHLEFMPYEPPKEEGVPSEIEINETQEVLPLKIKAHVKQLHGNEKRSNGMRETAASREIDEDYELPLPNESPPQKHVDKYMQTLLLVQPLERRCKNLLGYCRTGIEEAGINYLYLAIGFLEWREIENTSIINRAPLILLPLRIERTRLNRKTNCYSYVISYSGEDPSVPM